MKKYIYTMVAVLLAGSMHVQAQTINWASLKRENKHITSANVGIENGAVYGIGYGRQIKTKWFPVVLNAELSIPSGNTLVDDFKSKIGGQVRVAQYRNFQFSAKIQGVFRREQNSFATLLNFGSDMSAIAGYYRKKWFAAGEFGFDKAIVTHFKHSEAYKAQYASVVDGWYEPATGGNFHYGIQAGFSWKKYDLFIKAGKVVSQDFKTDPLLPFYAQIGFNVKF